MFVGNNTVPEIIAGKLDYHYINLASADISNNQIHKRIVDFTIENKNFDNYLLFIGWTNPNKLDAQYNNQYYTYQPTKRDYPDLLMNKLHKFDHYLFDRIVISQRFASTVYGVQNLLDNLNIKYYMINTEVPLIYNTYTEKTIRNLNHKYLYDMINAASTMTGWLEQSNHDEFNEEARNEYASFLLRKMRGCGVIDRPK